MTRTPQVRQGYNNRTTRQAPRRGGASHHGGLTVFGLHVVRRLLETYPIMTTSVMVREGLMEEMREFARTVGYKGPLHVAKESELDKKAKGAIHQGVIAEIPGFPYAPIESIGREVKLILVLDQIQDPQNVGALIRSAAAFGCGAVVLPEHEQAGVTGAVARASAGTIFDIPVVKVGNISQTFDYLKERGFWIVGLAGESNVGIDEYVFDAPTVLVVGSEGDGIRDGVRKNCDAILSIPMTKGVESLNVSVAGAIALFHAYRAMK
jgi:23S rRNA (guanosine2251-2'-O)-methyltransferase